MNSIGIMQGRLTPRGSSKSIQFFPFDNWQKEFSDAKEIGLSEIEWIFDFDRFEENPLWTDAGCNEMNKVISEAGVAVNTICADYFMSKPLSENMKMLEKIIINSKRIGAKRIEIPFLSRSSIKNEEEERIAVKALTQAIDIAKREDILLNIEIDFPPQKLKNFIANLNIGITYDSGNSSGLGFDAKEEISAYGEFITNVHIKDRVNGGTTVELGTGSADFKKVFDSLKKVNYKGSFILQAARGLDGDEMETVKKQKEFVEFFIK